MSRLKRLQPVKRLADDKADAAARELAAAQQRLGDQEQRLRQLQEFRAQYQRQRVDSGGSGMDGFRLRDFNAFIGRLDQAISHQQRLIAQSQMEVERLRRLWTEQLRHAKAIDKVVARCAEDERQAEERRAQREADAFAQLRRPLPQGS